MGVLQVLHTIVLGPLELLFDVVYAMALGITGNPGLSLIFLSLAINLLVLPLYRRADAMQEEEREQSIRLKPGVDHIRKAFKGDERFMILQTYYRQNNYKPYYALKGSLSLLLEIPFFIAAYHYLSSLNLLQGASFGPIGDLGAPDNLIVIGGVSLHLLPILMTAINIVSGMIYTKGMPLKSKIQLYGMALVFLVLLYESPAGLVFYWTLNNLFSLVKNVFYKLPNPKKVIGIMCSVIGGVILVAGLMYYTGIRRKFLTIIVAVLLQLPLFGKYIKKDRKSSGEDGNRIDDKAAQTIFYACCAFMAILVGGLIPSAIISTSTSEFVELGAYHSPLRFVVRTALIAIGVFLVWCFIFYKLSSDKTKRKFSLCSVAIILCATVEYMFFGKGYGNISPLLKYDIPIEIPAKAYLLNLLILACISGVVCFAWKKGKGELIKGLCMIGCFAITAMSVMNVMKIRTEAADLEKQAEQKRQETPEFTLSKNGKNVVVIMMDRAIGAFVPYILEEKPELKEQFAGFTYYPNTLSFGISTNVGTPPIYGGYEYMPFEMNSRSDELLKDKHNEALKVMPVIFSNEGFKVTVCDPPYANYEGVPDLSIFDGYDDIKSYVTHGAFNEDEVTRIAQKEKIINRNLFCYSLFRVTPLFLHKEVYDGGNYNYADNYGKADEEAWSYAYNPHSEYSSSGVRDDFMSAYRALQNLPFMTKISDSDENTYMSFSNTTTHDVMMLQEPEYEPKNEVDNTEYEKEHAVRTAPGAKDLQLTTVPHMEHYQCDMASFIQLGKWFDYLRENGVWDNTRIIITADHGRPIGLYNILWDNPDSRTSVNEYEDVMSVNPLFMIKDFGSNEFTVSDEFMTNADVPTEACRGIIEVPINPFTGNAINENRKNDDEIYAMYTEWSIDENHGYTFVDPLRITLKNKYMFDRNNWSYGD